MDNLIAKALELIKDPSIRSFILIIMILIYGLPMGLVGASFYVLHRTEIEGSQKIELALYRLGDKFDRFIEKELAAKRGNN